MEEQLRQFIGRRANGRCEYCHLPQDGHEQRFSIDHLTARKHGGTEAANNLVFCRIRCNLHKGTDLTGIDPDTNDAVLLFNPRAQLWRDRKPGQV